MKTWSVIIWMIILFAGCRKVYNPAPIKTNYNYLVVEGTINNGDTTFINLSRTVTLSGQTRLSPELNAAVTVENDQSTGYTLTETKKGIYFLAGVTLDVNRKYRLRIKTINNQEYLSDFVAVTNSPPIDSISYAIESNGIQVYANTHDPKNNTRYYRWAYNETWQIHSIFDSFFKSNGDTVLFRDLVNDDIYTCWQTDTSSTIILGSSAKLTNDVIYQNPVTFVPSTSVKLVTGYSILVKQYAITGDAYTFWGNLKKNTEQLGSVFDALPTQINGNIHCISNPSLPVIGYINAGSVTTKRILIHNRNLPAWLPPPILYDLSDSCGYVACLYKYVAPGSGITVNQVDQLINYNKGAKYPLIPIDVIKPPGAPAPIGYTAAFPICVDCTLRGTNKMPPYWKY